MSRRQVVENLIVATISYVITGLILLPFDINIPPVAWLVRVLTP